MKNVIAVIAFILSIATVGCTDSPTQPIVDPVITPTDSLDFFTEGWTQESEWIVDYPMRAITEPVICPITQCTIQSSISPTGQVGYSISWYDSYTGRFQFIGRTDKCHIKGNLFRFVFSGVSGNRYIYVMDISDPAKWAGRLLVQKLDNTAHMYYNSIIFAL